jgi:hypothetical protein
VLNIAAGPTLTLSGLLTRDSGSFKLANGADVNLTGTMESDGVGLFGGGAGTLHLSGTAPRLRTIDASSGTIHLATSQIFNTAWSKSARITGSGALLLSGNVQVNNATLQLGSTAATPLESVSGSNVWSGTVSLTNASRITVDSGTLTLQAPVSGQALTKSGGGVLAAQSIRITGPLAIDAGTLAISTSGTAASCSSVPSVALAGGTLTPSATLDLADNDLRVSAMSLIDVSTAIRTARDSGAWDRAGLSSAAARTNPQHNTTLGVMSGADYRSIYGSSALFDTLAVADTDVLVKYTYYGDTDFSGRVNFDDYARLDAGFNNGGHDWFHGDLDLNGVINFDDYALIDLAFNTQGAALRSVPEPGSLFVIGLVLVSIVQRRGGRVRSTSSR